MKPLNMTPKANPLNRATGTMPPDIFPLPADRIHAARKLSRRRKLLKRLVGPKNCQALLDSIPSAGCATHAALAGTFVMADFIIKILEEVGPTVDLELASLNISASNAHRIDDAKKRGLITGKVKLLLSHYFAQQKGFNANLEEAEKVADVVKIARVHAKVFLLKPGGNPLVIETSGNLRASGNVEQLSMFSCPDLHEFHRRWMAEIEPENVKTNDGK